MTTTVSSDNRSLYNRIHTGTGDFPIVSSRRKIYVLALSIIAVCIASIIFRGFTFGIDFLGGTTLTAPARSVDTASVSASVSEAIGTEISAAQVVGSGSARVLEISTEFLDSQKVTAAKEAITVAYQAAGEKLAITDIGDSTRSESWGGQVTNKALIALVVFLVVIAVYIAIRFEWHMSLAAIITLGFDLTVTSGVYSIVGFEVTPATVIGLLTILGFSLYDTVVVYDKVQDNTSKLSRIQRSDIATYAKQANLAVNQTLMRSISTTVIGVLPIVALAIIAVWLLGVGTLKDLALVQIVGIVVGTFSSIFIATPLLVTVKNVFGSGSKR